MDHFGVLYHAHGSIDGTYTPAQVPLEDVNVNVWVVDVTARVTLIQKFFNNTPARTGRAKYCFPVPASAAICSFQLSTSDGRTIRGECKETELAQEQFEAAAASGQMAGLMEYVADDVFTISIGHVPPYVVLETRLVYVMTLYTGDYLDQVRFQLPSHVGQRYGIPPEGLESSFQPIIDRTRVSITIDIQMSGRIQNVVSPSHMAEISETRYSTHLGRSSRRRTTVRYESDSYLDRDFILVVHARDLDKPRCFVEVRKDARHPDSIALQLTMVPRTVIPAIRSQRYLFVVDRSGSMDGSRIETAKRTVLMMLRMLPPQGSMFNIFGFGNTCVAWRSKSEVYTQNALEEATSHVEGIRADLSGTEIKEALCKVFSTSPPDMPTVVFVLTDGESNDVHDTKLEVARFVKSSSPPRRVFTLGIGSGISTAMCEGIARAGRGECLLAVDTESIVQKCVKLFAAARTPFIRNISLDWGIANGSSQAGSPEVTFSNQPSPRTVATRPLPPIQQAPHQVEAIHSGTRMNIFAIITSRHASAPKVVVLSGILDDETNEPFQMRIPVLNIALVHSDGDIPLIHTMAAWKLIQEYSENTGIPLPQPMGIATEEELRQSVIVQLGVQYQVASQHTSFVAVEEPRDSHMGRKLKQTFLHKHPEHADVDADSEESISGPLEIARHRMQAVWTAMTSALTALTAMSSLWINKNNQPQPNAGEPLSRPTGSLPGSWPQGEDEPLGSPSASDDERTGSTSSVQTFSTLSSLDQWSRDGSSDWSSISTGDDDQNMPSPTFRPRPLDADRTPPQHESRSLQTVPPSVVELVKLQRFDGSFTRIESIRGMVGVAAVNEVQRLSGPDRDAWATVLSIAYLKKHLSGNPELLENLLIKPLEFLRSMDGINVDQLLERASRLLE